MFDGSNVASVKFLSQELPFQLIMHSTTALIMFSVKLLSLSRRDAPKSKNAALASDDPCFDSAIVKSRFLEAS